MSSALPHDIFGLGHGECEIPMSRQRALEVRELRIARDCTWRRIAELLHERWGGNWQPPWNQIEGQHLCGRAAALLGEDWL